MKWEIERVESWKEAEQLAKQGWELVSVTQVYKEWENQRKGCMESETYETYYFKRPKLT